MNKANSLLKTHIDNKKFHHGYLLTGDFEISRKMAFEASEVILGTGAVNKLDFFYKKFNSLSIDDSREIKRLAARRPFVGSNKVFVVEISSFSIESSNALLKILEEPYEGTHFFILVPFLEDVFPTVRSRLTVVRNPLVNDISEEKEKFYSGFLASLPSRRLEVIKRITQDREKTIEFINELEVVFYKKNKNHEILEEMQKCKDFLYQKGSSPKIILEHIALTLP